MAERRAQKKGKASDALSEADLASDLMGNNQLQGDSQANVHNERHAVAGVKTEPDDGPLESFEMLDKDTRARRELGKGHRHSDEQSTNKDEEQ